jgi:hypothetical protein
MMQDDLDTPQQQQQSDDGGEAIQEKAKGMKSANPDRQFRPANPDRQ